MVVTAHRHIVGLAMGIVAIGFLVPRTLSAQTVTLGSDGMVWVRASEVPLGHLLRALADLKPFRKLTVDPKVEAQPVTLTLESADFRSALIEVLRSAGVNYTLSGDDWLWVLDVGTGSSAQPGVASEVRRFAGDNDRRLRDPAKTQEAEAAAAADRDSNWAEEQWRQQQLEMALTARPQPPGPGGLVLVPFPDADGNPIIGVVPLDKVKGGLPFPAAAASPPASAQTNPPPATTAPMSPGLAQLINALTPTPAPRK